MGDVGLIIAVLGLAYLFSRREESFQPGGYSYFQQFDIYPHQRVIEEQGLGEEMEAIEWPTYPQVTAETRLDPRTPQYERKLERKYPRELRRTREAHAKTRKLLGLREYTPPPMPRYTRARRGR